MKNLDIKVRSNELIFIVAIMLANKFLVDDSYSDQAKVYAEDLGILINEVNRMELEFLDALDYWLSVSQTQYYEWIKSLFDFHFNDKSNWLFKLAKIVISYIFGGKKSFIIPKQPASLDPAPNYTDKILDGWETCQEILLRRRQIQLYKRMFS